MTDLIISDQRSIVPNDMEQALGEFLRLNVADGSASLATIETYYSHLKQYTTWCNDEGVEPTRATEDDIKNYRAWMVESGHARSTIHGRLVAIRKLFEAAIWRGFRSDNPAKGVRAPKDKTDPSDKVKFLPLEGFKNLLNTPNIQTTKGRRDRAILAAMGMHGLRVDEVAQLTLDSITDDKLTITGKGQRSRTIYLITESQAVLDAWLADRHAIRAGEKTVFVSLGNRSYGQPLTTRGIRHLVDGYLGQCGLKGEGISCHSLRHSFATWATFRGAKIEHLQAALGHSKRETTSVYQGAVDRVKNNPALLLGDLLSGAN